MTEPKKEKTDRKKDGVDFHLMVLESERKRPGQKLRRMMKDLERKYGK